jgi:putative hemolysin
VLAVDFSETDEARQTNLRSRARARDHLAKGGCVIVFPAGGVSTAPDKLGRKPAVDAPWGLFTPQLIQRAKATVVPICFSGQNSRLFQIASHLSLTLRLSLIFREVKNRIGTALSVAIGDPIPFQEIASIRDRQKLADMLRQRTYSLETHSRRSGNKELPESALSAFWRVWHDSEQSGRRAALSRPRFRRPPSR